MGQHGVCERAIRLPGVMVLLLVLGQQGLVGGWLVVSKCWLEVVGGLLPLLLRRLLHSWNVLMNF